MLAAPLLFLTMLVVTPLLMIFCADSILLTNNSWHLSHYLYVIVAL